MVRSKAVWSVCLAAACTGGPMFGGGGTEKKDYRDTVSDDTDTDTDTDADTDTDTDTKGVVDNDKDGYTEAVGDCNDADAAIHPGAAETAGDKVDSNCDGADDT